MPPRYIEGIQQGVVRLPDLSCPLDRILFRVGRDLQPICSLERQQAALRIGFNTLLEKIVPLILHLIQIAELGSVKPDLGQESESHQGLLVDIHHASFERGRVILFQD